MAYKTTIAKACANRDAALAEIWSQLSSMGWTLVDGSCTPVTVPYTDVSVANDTFTYVGHAFTDGMPVQLKTTGTAPGALSTLTQYYIVSVSGSTFKLSTTYNGSGVNISSQGTGNHTITESFRVYSSNGESGAKIPEYIRVSFWSSATTVLFSASYSHSNTTHAQIGGIATYTGGITTNETSFYLWIYGNKDVVSLLTKISTTYTLCLFGHFKSFFTLQTALTAGATNGAGATLTVASTAGFEVGSTYQILGASAEGRDELTIASIVSSTSMTVSNLPRDYASGALIGDRPSTFLVTRVTNENYAHVTCPIKVVGTTDATQYSYGVLTSMLLEANIDPDSYLNKTVLSPVLYAGIFNNNNTTPSTGLYFDTTLYQTPTTGFTNEDTLYVGKLESGTSTGTGNTSSVLNDSGKSWTTNAYAGKVLVITFGTGIGQIKKITSNTATALTLAGGWTFSVIPDSTSQYVICEEGYRVMWTAVSGLAYREGY